MDLPHKEQQRECPCELERQHPSVAQNLRAAEDEDVEK